MKLLINRKGKKYLKKRFKKAGLKFDKQNVENELTELLSSREDKMPEDLTVYIVNGDELNGRNVSWFGKKIIEINGRYVLDCYIGEDKVFAKECFIDCIGHELGHLRAFARFPFLVLLKAIFPIFATKRDRFRAQLLELYCDKYSLSFSGYDVELVLDIIQEHINRKKKSYKDYQHPTWEKRIEYLKCDFGADLIKDFAHDIGYDNTEEINTQIQYYEKVNSDNGYIDKVDLLVSYARVFASIAVIVGVVAYLNFMV